MRGGEIYGDRDRERRGCERREEDREDRREDRRGEEDVLFTI